jgi:hypothetical protein
MPNFLSWGMNQNQQFGAYVQLNASVFKPQPDGSVQVEKAPRTEFFDQEKVARLAETAGPKTQPFWKEMSETLPKQEALYNNSRDIAESASAKSTAQEQGLNLTNKPTFSA